MPDIGDDGGGEQQRTGDGSGSGPDSSSDPDPVQNSGSLPDPSASVISIVISQPPEEKPAISKSDATVAAAKKGFLPRDNSYHEQCRVCQQQAEEPLIDLGCRCRGDLAKAHRSCIDLWFQTRGSNKCEICQQVAANVSSPDSQPSGCFSPLWVAFAILIGGLLLDVLISVSLGVSALPVNIIIGVLIVLGLGTAFRLALECCQDWGSRRHVQSMDIPINPGYHPAV
ncbi:E3 ubiquitin-protein ligase MARCH9 isoform X3 [Asparagus officinalis]|uniref:E3 ubiquitin-protein ligase MARCH9 isoform X3 n=1 Tax=Asparagus officinalis TaxID=4686 RepID=UPI00098E3C3A|nr:E3 ubiquitin-protein ligase MARCH9 isoform X3 [Asparagus officinalis]